MPEEKKIVETELLVTDKATRPLGALAAAAENISKRFNGLSMGVASFGGMAAAGVGAFGIGEMIKGAGEYIGRIRKISSLTDLSAERADGLVEAMDDVGLKGEAAESILSKMSRKGQMLEGAMLGAGAAVGGIDRNMRNLGIDLAHGVEPALMSMATAVGKGKLNAAQLSMMIRVPYDEAVKLHKLLAKGPEGLAESVDELRKKGIALTQSDLDTFGAISAAKNRIASGWERIQVIIGKEVLPIIAKLLENTEKSIPKWIEYAKTFGKFLNEHLETGLSTVVKIGKVLLANAAIQSGTKALGMGNGEGVGAAGLAGAIGKKAFGGTGAAGLGGIGMGAVVAGVTKLTVAGGLLYKVAQGVEQIFTNAGGVADWLQERWDALASHFDGIASTFEPLLGSFGEGGVIGQFFKYLIPSAIGGLIGLIETAVQVVQTMWRTLSEQITHFMDPSKQLGLKGNWDAINKETQERVARRQAAREEAARLKAAKTPSDRASMNMNFYDARFNIQQSFAEGMEPDRIAVAFTHDLARLGEKRLQSAFAPAFGVKG